MLIDNDSTFNMLQMHILDLLSDDASHIHQRNMMEMGYDGSSRYVIGDIDVDLVIRPL